MKVLKLFLLFCLLWTFNPAYSETRSEWNGYDRRDFNYNGRKATVVAPEKALDAEQKQNIICFFGRIMRRKIQNGFFGASEIPGGAFKPCPIRLESIPVRHDPVTIRQPDRLRIICLTAQEHIIKGDRPVYRIFAHKRFLYLPAGAKLFRRFALLRNKNSIPHHRVF